MRKFFILAIALSLFTLPARADDVKTPDITIKVSGLVCDFCARAIEHVFLKQEAVKTVGVDLDNGRVTLGLKPGKAIDDKTLTSLINDSGYTVTGIERRKDKS